jgi:hypothetical protein
MLAAALWAPTARAVPVVEDKEKGILINVGALIQPQFQMTMSGANSETGPCGAGPTDRCSAGIGNPRGDGPSYDFFVRRARLMLWGSATKEISFFFDTDEPNIGKGGNFAAGGFIVQDAFATYSFNPMARIDAGLMLVPFSRHTLEGATSLNSLDYHSDLVRYPTGRVWRDAGLQFRGVALQDHLHYRLGLFEGVRNAALPAAPPAPAPARTIINPGGVPRLTAMVRGNIMGVEPDFFFKGIHFSKTPIITLGAGFDFQPNSVIKLDTSHGHYMAASGDVFVEYPFTENDELIVKGNFYYYGEGATTIAGTTMVPAGATAFYAEAGFRHAWIEPVVFLDMLNGAKGKTAAAASVSTSIMAPHVGVNFWIMKHNFNIKTDFGYKKTERTALAVRPPGATANATEETKLAPQKDIIWTTQMQLFF